jgi:hypothetical protein
LNRCQLKALDSITFQEIDPPGAEGVGTLVMLSMLRTLSALTGFGEITEEK